MGIQPIDLQTMYSQLSNVSKTMQGAQQTQLADEMSQQSNIQKTMEQTSKVQQTSNEKANTNGVNQNGSNSSSFYGKRQNKKNEKDDGDVYNEYENHPGKCNSDYLGTIIDITR